MRRDKTRMKKEEEMNEKIGRKTKTKEITKPKKKKEHCQRGCFCTKRERFILRFI